MIKRSNFTLYIHLIFWAKTINHYQCQFAISLLNIFTQFQCVNILNRNNELAQKAFFVYSHCIASRKLSANVFQTIASKVLGSPEILERSFQQTAIDDTDAVFCLHRWWWLCKLFFWYIDFYKSSLGTIFKIDRTVLLLLWLNTYRFTHILGFPSLSLEKWYNCPNASGAAIKEYG